MWQCRLGLSADYTDRFRYSQLSKSLVADLQQSIICRRRFSSFTHRHSPPLRRNIAVSTTSATMHSAPPSALRTWTASCVTSGLENLLLAYTSVQTPVSSYCRTPCDGYLQHLFRAYTRSPSPRTLYRRHWTEPILRFRQEGPAKCHGHQSLWQPTTEQQKKRANIPSSQCNSSHNISSYLEGGSGPLMYQDLRPSSSIPIS